MYEIMIILSLSADLRLEGIRGNERAVGGAVAVLLPELAHRMTDAHEGFALTARHCIEPGFDYSVETRDGVKFPCCVLGSVEDVALLIVTKVGGHRLGAFNVGWDYTYTFRDCIAMGCPGGRPVDTAWIKPIQINKDGMLWCDGGRIRGHSGGPLFDGNIVIGICSASGSGGTFEDFTGVRRVVGKSSVFSSVSIIRGLVESER